jgi:DNA polymerase
LVLFFRKEQSSACLSYMQSVVLQNVVDFAGWRTAARSLALQGVPPEQVVWSVEEADDLFAEPAETAPVQGAFSVPRSLVALAETVIQANDPARFGLLYALIWRAHRGEKRLLEDAADPLVQRLIRLGQAVRRDTHKMRAFLRFRTVTEGEATRYVAWFEPDHYIVEANAAFFVRRFATMQWSILTPYRSVHWDGEAVRLAPGARRDDVPDDDALAAYWRAYFSSIFNPARLKVSAMVSEMPKKYWHNLPEAAAIPDLIREARARTETMVEAPVFSPQRASRTRETTITPRNEPGQHGLAAEAATCKRCSLWEHATQTVFGEGPHDASIMLVGEQPGDQEDLAGRPFVGPAGQVLDRALQEAGIIRGEAYVTNAVKHFKFEPRGKRRIHATPDRSEIETCRFWLDRELASIKPDVVILLGASAARAVLGRAVTISRERGRPLALGEGVALITVHPSYLLRLPDEQAKQREYAAFVSDLRSARSLMSSKNA